MYASIMCVVMLIAHCRSPDPEAEIKKKNEEDARQQLQMISTVYLGSDVHQARMDASVRRDHEFRQQHLQNYLRYPSRSSDFLYPPDEKALQAKKTSTNNKEKHDGTRPKRWVMTHTIDA